MFKRYTKQQSKETGVAILIYNVDLRAKNYYLEKLNDDHSNEQNILQIDHTMGHVTNLNKLRQT